jgi:hypothetical protein
MFITTDYQARKEWLQAKQQRISKRGKRNQAPVPQSVKGEAAGPTTFNKGWTQRCYLRH